MHRKAVQALTSVTDQPAAMTALPRLLLGAAALASAAAGPGRFEFDWAALTSPTTRRALPPAATEGDSDVDDSCDSGTALQRLLPLALPAPPSLELAPGYTPERLQLGQGIGGFQLTSFLRRIPLLPPRHDATTSLQVQQAQQPDLSSAVTAFLGLALPSGDEDEAAAPTDDTQLALLSSATLPIFDPDACYTAVSTSLLALPAAADGRGEVAMATQVALARVRPASLSPEEQQLHSDHKLALRGDHDTVARAAAELVAQQQPDDEDDVSKNDEFCIENEDFCN